MERPRPDGPGRLRRAYFSGKLTDYALPQEEIDRALADLADFPKPLGREMKNVSFNPSS